ncbi:MAG TPA: hypothetical protein VFB38_19600 [Chthonomonadaceae bacterium]|jgi:hypothetical protein|nr:hypothetical protein [Chthonomonadaceae bacterium]
MAQEKVREPELSPAGYTPEEERVHQMLIEAGLLKEVKPRSRECKLDRPTGEICGKPLSETIIEERR